MDDLNLTEEQKLDIVVEIGTGLICAIASYIHKPSANGREDIASALRKVLVITEQLE
jgi:hypothetical protein